MNLLSRGRWHRHLIWGLVGYLLSLLMASVVSGQTIVIQNRAASSYTEPGRGQELNTTSEILELNDTGGLIDPFGQILDCNGEEFPDYTGFVAGLFEPANEMGEVGGLVPLTGTTPNNGISPNVYNVNPYPLTNEAINGKRGLYNFLLDRARGQTEVGKNYILLITPPPNSDLAERRVRIVISQQEGNVISYQAIAVDGKPISLDGRTVASSRLYVPDAAVVPLNLFAMQLRLTACEAQPLQIIKTADRAAAEPGDTALYRISVRNRSSAPLTNLVITDTLPLGFQYVPNSVRAEMGGNPVAVQVTINGRSLTFTVNDTMPPKGGQDQSLNLVYAVQITPDALRGDGKNRAIARGIISNQTVADGPAIYTMAVRPGIVNDCGTIIGKVFEDKNSDGEQQEGEPGIPNAVIFMDDGNRIQTDSRGLYSVKNVLPGPRTLVLDLTSIPGYQIAPHPLLERNSPSRLVRMSPGSLARVNFAVVPYQPPETKEEAKEP